MITAAPKKLNRTPRKTAAKESLVLKSANCGLYYIYLLPFLRPVGIQ